MSTKDNWDDSSDDDEGENPPDPPCEGKYDEVQFVDAKASKEEYQSDDDEFVDAKASEEGYPTEEYTPEEYTPEEYTPDDEWGGEGGDPSEDDDYEDELDDYDKKLGRYVSCR